MSRYFIILASILFVNSFTLLAEEQETSSINEPTGNEVNKGNIQGERIVILGKRPRPIGDVFGAASVISRETIDKELVHDIADLVRYQAGIDVERAGSRFGLSGFSIRGIGGNRVATEIDGIPVADQFDVGSYSNSGRNFIDTDLVQQVEILRGPASSVYGSNAIGGVISFITKKPVDLLKETNGNFYAGIKAGYYGVDSSQAISLSTAYAFDKMSLLINLNSRNGNEFDNNAPSDIAVDHQDNKSQSVLAKFYYDISDHQQISLSYDYFERESDTQINSLIGLGRFARTTALTGDDQSERKNVALSYTFDSEKSWLSGGVATIYNQKTETLQLTEETRSSRGSNYLYNRDFFYIQEIDGLRINLYTDFDAGSLYHQIGYGLEWSERKVTEFRDGLQTNLATGASTNSILSEVFPVRDFPISVVKEIGLYLNDEIEIQGTNFSLIPALRFDQYELNPSPDAIYLEDNPATQVVSVKESNLSPKLGLQYEINSKNSWFVQYFEGFRAPPFEDANIGLDIPLFNMRAIPNPDLKSEFSKGYELGYRYKSANTSLDVIGFYTDYRDFIQTKVNLGFDPVAGRILFQSQNIDSAKIYGMEVQYKTKFNDWFSDGDSVSAYANLFLSKGENKETDQPLNDINPNHAILGINWQSASQAWTVSLHNSLYQAKSDIDDLDDPAENLFKTPGYGLFDLIVNYQLNDFTSVSAAVYNLADKRYWRWSDVNGLVVDDPLIETLSASGRNASLQVHIAW